MKYMIYKCAAAGSVLAMSSAPLFAQVVWRRRPHSVPEIDASAGILTIAAVVAVMAFVWERKRRQAA